MQPKNAQHINFQEANHNLIQKLSSLVVTWQGDCLQDQIDLSGDTSTVSVGDTSTFSTETVEAAVIHCLHLDVSSLEVKWKNKSQKSCNEKAETSCHL